MVPGNELLHDYQIRQPLNLNAGDGDGDGEPSSARPMADQTVPVDSEGSTVGEEAGEGGTEGVDVEATQVCV